MADQMTDYFHAHKDATMRLEPLCLSHKHASHVRACEKTALFMMHASGVYSVYRFMSFHTSAFLFLEPCWMLRFSL